jgi:Ring finger domain
MYVGFLVSDWFSFFAWNNTHTQIVRASDIKQNNCGSRREKNVVVDAIDDEEMTVRAVGLEEEANDIENPTILRDDPVKDKELLTETVYHKDRHDVDTSRHESMVCESSDVENIDGMIMLQENMTSFEKVVTLLNQHLTAIPQNPEVSENNEQSAENDSTEEIVSGKDPKSTIGVSPTTTRNYDPLLGAAMTNHEVDNGWLILRGKNRTTNIVNTSQNSNSDEKSIIEDQLTCSLRTTKHVTNCCAICLDTYEPQDIVVWSPSSSDCQHAFHENCILDWMCTNQKGTPCPMCRQDILPNLHQYYDGKYIKRYNLVAPESTFSLGAIRFR